MNRLIIVLSLFLALSTNLIAQNKENAKEQPSFLQAPRSTNQFRNIPADPTVESYNSRFFGVGIFGTTAVVKSYLNTPTVLTTISATTRSIFGGAFSGTGVWYGLEYIAAGSGNLVTIDTATGAMVTIGSLPGLTAGHTVTGLSWNKINSTMYALSTDGASGTLYTINLSTSALTTIGNTTGSLLPIDMSFNNEGILYSVDIGTDVLNTLNISTGAATAVGPLGVDLNFAQGMCIDPSTDSLFLASYNLTLSLGQLLRCNTTTGATTLIGNLGSSQTELDAFVIPGAPRPPTALNPFNLLTPVAGARIVTIPGSTVPVTITWDTSASGANYKWVFGNPIVPPRRITIPSSSNSISTTLGALDAILAANGFTNNGSATDSAVGQWNVWAIKGSGAPGVDSLVSTNGPRAITLKRGIPAIITASPDSLVVNLQIGQTTTRNLLLGNTGSVSLDWTISESSTALDILSTPNNFTEDQINQMVNQPKGTADLFHGEEQTDGMGGPDAGGYRWIDSDEPGGPAFNWVEINAVGTQITTWTNGTPDDGSVTVPLPFSFSYYGNSYSSLKIVTNGWVGFDVASTNTAYTNVAIPDPTDPNNCLYPFWDDLNLTTSGSVYYYNDAANNRFIVEYKDVPHYLSGELYTFQVILNSDGRIYYQYLSMTASLVNSCTIGTENVGGATGLQVVYNAAYLHNNLAIKIEKGLAWLDETPSSGLILPGGNQNVSVAFNATGLTIGTYTGVLKVNSNDPVHPVKNVGIRLNVGLVGVQNTELGIPAEFDLQQNYPNPFNPTTKISFSIPRSSFVTLKVYDVLGKEVSRLVNESKEAGYYDLNFDASSLGSGIYFYKIEAGNFTQTKRMLLIK